MGRAWWSRGEVQACSGKSTAAGDGRAKQSSLQLLSGDGRGEVCGAGGRGGDGEDTCWIWVTKTASDLGGRVWVTKLGLGKWISNWVTDTGQPNLGMDISA